MHRFLLPVLLLTLALVLPAVAGEDDAKGGALHPDNLLVDTLDNGLRLVIEERPSVPIARVHAYMKIGSIYEGEYLGSGLSHYMEHIVSGGSTVRAEVDESGKEVRVGRTEEENGDLLKSIGGNSNASTYYNYTQYYITTKSEMVETAVDLISGYLQHCQFDAGEVEREQRVVQQELLRNLDDANRERALLFTETMFKVHPARIPVIGYRDCIQAITRDDMLAFYNEHYMPQNCVVSVVGDVDKYEMRDMLAKYFGGWKQKSHAPYMIPQEPEQLSPRWVEKEHGSTQTCLVAMGVPTISLRDPDLYKLDMLSNVLGLGAAARLPRKFEHDRNRDVIATRIGTGSTTPVYGAGRFACYFGTDTIENARTLVHEIWDEMGRLKEELVSDEEIARALKVLEKYYFMGRATVDDRAEELASNLAWLDDPLFSDSYLENIRTVTPEQIREAARTYLREDKLNVVIVKPPVAEGVRAARDSTEGHGETRRVTLDNGLTLLLKRLPGYGMVDAAAAFHGGVIYEDEATNGLFFLMANAFWRGTESKPFNVMMDEMDQLGMTFEAESHNNVYYVKMRCLASDFEPSLAMYSDILLHPALDPQWVERVKMLLLTRVLPNLGVNAEEMMQKVIRNTLYKTHPYRMQRFGTTETVSSFTADQVRELYETFTRPNNCVLALYGDLDLDATEAMVKRYFGTWEKGEVPASHVVEEPALAENMTVDLENNQVRTNYRIAWRALSRQADDSVKAAMSLMTTIMGGSGWLHERLRGGDNDYVYSVYSRPYNGDKAGHYFVDTDISPEDEATVLEIIQGVIADIQAGTFTDDELELARKMILSYEALGKKENENVVSSDALSVLFGEDLDHTEKYYAAIRSVTRQDVIDVAKRIFESNSLQVFVRPAHKSEGEPAPPKETASR